tara:strand:+ start:554 stop:1024 length:471 start_codon:yes stop_codon:yes gene_type:complete
MKESQMCIKLQKLKDAVREQPVNEFKSKKLPLTDDANLKAIMYTNEKYQKQLAKRLVNKPTETIVMTSQTFNDFVNHEIDNIQHLNWTQIPITHKYKYVVDYIENDKNLSDVDREYFKSKTNTTTAAKKKLVKYDKKNGIISKLNYEILDLTESIE